MLSYQANGLAPAVEAIEADVPVVMLRHEPLPDSGGPGAIAAARRWCATRCGRRPPSTT